MSVTVGQIAMIQVLAKRAGMDEDTRRDFLEREAGVRSTRALTREEAARVIDKLQPLAGQGGGVKGAVAGLDSPVAKKLRALWIAGWNLGLVRDRSDRAMLAFLERQTGVSHTRFLREPGTATSAIEGLKRWLARDGGVVWPADAGDVDASKRAVIEAQWARLGTPGAQPDAIADLAVFARKVAGKVVGQPLGSADLDAVSAALGRRLRDALARRPAVAS